MNMLERALVLHSRFSVSKLFCCRIPGSLIRSGPISRESTFLTANPNLLHPGLRRFVARLASSSSSIGRPDATDDAQSFATCSFTFMLSALLRRRNHEAFVQLLRDST